MADGTHIEWADHTHNPWIGCTKVSAACDHCYAETWANRFFAGDELWSGGLHRTSLSTRNAPFRWNREAKAAGVRRRVFCLSLGDFADNQVPEPWRDELWETIAQCQYLDWLILSKRPQNYVKMLPKSHSTQLAGMDWPWPHVWIGTTAENQEEANRRVPHLLATPAARRFISAEPLLSAIDLRNLVVPRRYGSGLLDAYTLDFKDHHQQILAGPPSGHGSIDWVIAGGESGPGARPWSIHWARELRDQCSAAGVPFFWKQNGEWVPAGLGPSGESGVYAFGDYEYDRAMRVSAVDGRPRHFTTFGARSVMKRVGKRAAGRLLDGREHSEFPG